MARRARREPISHILGRKGFWTLMLDVGPAVLTPRPETETLLDVVLPLIPPERAFSVLDLGVGSGAILLAILAERPAAKGLGVDVSEEALAVARDNAAQLGLAGRVALLRGDWTFGLSEAAFDLVVANPPYIPTADLATLEPEVRDFEPQLALDGGVDGLDAYRALAPEILRVLRPGGFFAVEIGPGQRGGRSRRCSAPPAPRASPCTTISAGASGWWPAPRKPLETKARIVTSDSRLLLEPSELRSRRRSTYAQAQRRSDRRRKARPGARWRQGTLSVFGH